MNQIKPYPLWVGHAGDVSAFRDIHANGIRAVVQLAIEHPPVQAPRELIYLRFPLLDGTGNGRDLLCLTIDTVAGLVERQIPALVCCGAGISRSPAIVAAALATAFPGTFEDYLKRVTEGHPADVSPGLLEGIRATLRDIRST